MIRGRLAGMRLPVAGENSRGIERVIGQRHDRTAETAPAEPGPDNPFPPLGRLPKKTDKGIELGNTVLEKEPAALMGGEESFPKAGEIVVAEAFHAKLHAQVFLDDVPGALVLNGVVGKCLEVVRRSVGEMLKIRMNPFLDQAEGLPAFPVAFRVLRVNETVLAVGIEDVEMKSPRKGNGGKACRGTVDTHQMVLITEAGDRLVEDAAGNAHKLVFGALPQQDLFLFWKILSEKRAKGLQRGQLHGGAAAQPGPDGKIAGKQQVQASVGKGAGFLHHHLQNTKGVIDPGERAFPGEQGIRASLEILFLPACKAKLPVRTRAGGHPDFTVQGDPENLPTVVVGMVADKFDTSRGSGDHFRVCAEPFLELLTKVVFAHKVDFEAVNRG